MEPIPPIDSDTYVLAYTGADSDGFISTFTISSDGTTITEVDTVEHDTDNESFYNSLVQVDSDTYALAYDQGKPSGGLISTFDISSDGTITPIRIANHAAFASASDNFEHDPDGVNNNSFIQVDSDTYALAYASKAGATNQEGFIATFTISSDGETITEVDSLHHDTNSGVHNSLVQVDSDTFALAYQGTDGGGFISTFTIDSDGTITAVKTQSEGNNFEHDEQAAGATHRIVQDPNVKNLEMFEVVFTMIFAKPMDTSHVVVETENKYGIPETLYLIDALKVSNSIVETLTLEQESKFELIYEPGLEVDPEQSVYTMSIDPESEMDPEPPMEPDVKNVTCGKGTVLKDNLCVPKEWSFLDFFQFMKMFG